MSSLVGRDDDLAAVEALIARAPIVSIVGPPGVGKTALVEAVVRRGVEAGREFFFVSLADVTRPESVAARIFDAFDVNDVGSQQLVDVVGRLLADRQVVVVLDNFEQVVEAAPLVAQIATLTTARLLVTSRRPIGVSAELVVPLAPLDNAAAVELFVRRVHARDPNVVFSDLAAVGRVCQRLERLPLAIELAASRASTLPLAALEAALGDGLDVLGGGARDAPDRHRTMTAAVRWSVTLLAVDTRTLFRRIAVCAGASDLDSLASLGGAAGLDRGAVLGAVADLVEHHLLVREGDRYRMLEVIRDVALADLVAQGEGHEARQAHGVHFLAVAERASQAVLASDQAATLDLLEADRPNLTAAVRHAIADGAADAALRLCVALRFLWYVRGSISEGRVLFTMALALDGGSPSLRTQAMSEAAALARHAGDFESADRLSEEAVTDARAVVDDALLGAALLQRGFVLHLLGRYAEAKDALEECLALAEGREDLLGVARALHHLGLVAVWGDEDLGLAGELNARSLALFEELGNERHQATVLIAMADLARKQGDLVGARRFGRAAQTHVRRLGDAALAVYLLHNAAALEAEIGKFTRAVRLLAAAEAL